jgi:hypothetical protein
MKSVRDEVAQYNAYKIAEGLNRREIVIAARQAFDYANECRAKYSMISENVVTRQGAILVATQWAKVLAHMDATGTAIYRHTEQAEREIHWYLALCRAIALLNPRLYVTILRTCFGSQPRTFYKFKEDSPTGETLRLICQGSSGEQ